MYLDTIHLENMRVFEKASLEFSYPGKKPTDKPTPEFPNVNLILGNNGAGKSTILKAIALAALGPVAQKFSPYKLVRQISPKTRATRRVGQLSSPAPTTIKANCLLTWQDVGKHAPSKDTESIEADVRIIKRGDEEFVDSVSMGQEWEPIYSTTSPAFLAVGYGATRRVEADANSSSPPQRLRELPLRQQRVQGLFSEHFPLVALNQWLPSVMRNKGRFTQVVNRINDVLPEGYSFDAERDKAGNFLFRQGKALVPFPALSDGCRAFVGWVADLLYHICTGCPRGVKLVDNCGIVLVDEIDLHLHPEWQRIVIPNLAKAFPNIQFIFTSHSPIVVGTLERSNIWVCESNSRTGVSSVSQKDVGVNGLNSDQILLTSYFGLKSSRSRRKERQLDSIASAAERRIPKKAAEFIDALVTAYEDQK